jgi:hypothetical protein
LGLALVKGLCEYRAAPTEEAFETDTLAEFVLGA